MEGSRKQSCQNIASNLAKTQSRAQKAKEKDIMKAHCRAWASISYDFQILNLRLEGFSQFTVSKVYQFSQA